MAHHFAQSQDRGAVTQAADLFELVRDIEDRGALGAELAQGFEQDFNLLRGQNAGGLIHDQQFGVLQQAADDLDPLAFTGRKVADDAVGGQRQAVGLGHVANLLAEGAQLGRVLHPQGDVLGHAERVKQREMLEHHAHTGGACGAGLVRGKAGSVHLHRAAVGFDQPIDHLDQRRLARAVFPQQRVDLARRDPQ